MLLVRWNAAAIQQDKPVEGYTQEYTLATVNRIEE